MDGYVFLPRIGDKEVILEDIEEYRKKDDDELQALSVRIKKAGIFGVHRQALNLIAFNIVMKERFDDSPIEIIDSCLITIK
jgi:hypothetical protein